MTAASNTVGAERGVRAAASVDVAPGPDASSTPGAHSTPMAQQAFCARLRAHRERAGIRLSAIADSTKVSTSLLSALERNDLSRWPGGIYRRAFFREYVAAIGLPVEPLTREFAGLFCAEERAAAEPTPRSAADAPPLRLTLAPVSEWKRYVSRARAIAVAIDITFVVATAGLLAWATGTGLWPAIGALALCYHAVATACLGGSASLWWLAEWRPTLGTARPRRAPPGPRRHRRRATAPARRSCFGRARPDTGSIRPGRPGDRRAGLRKDRR